MCHRGDIGDHRPQQVTLLGNYPNPFNPVTTIRYAIPDDTHVSLTVYDALGRKIKTLVDTPQQAGNIVQTRKMTLVK